MKVVLSISIEGSGLWRDLEVPADRPAGELLPALLGALDAGGPASAAEDAHDIAGWMLLAAPSPRLLAPAETLAEAGVWTGGWLLLRPPSLA
jgi:hypothetical protein